MSGSLAGGSFPRPDVPRRDIPDLIANLPKPKSHPDWKKVKPEAEEPKTWVSQAAESVRNLPNYEYQLKTPEDLLKDPRIAEPVQEIATVMGLSTREVEEAVLALLSPPKTKRRH
jgi:hypothetical protein